MECPLFPFDDAGRLGGPRDHRSAACSDVGGAHHAQRDPARATGPRRGSRGRAASAAAPTRRAGAGTRPYRLLLKGCLDRGIEPRTDRRAVELVMDDRRVAGRAWSRRRPDETTVQARQRGRARDRRVRVGPRARSRASCAARWSVPSPFETNTGDGLKMAMQVGAALGNMREAWWAPTIDVPDGAAASLPGWSTASAAARTRSWSTAWACGSPTSARTTTRSARRSTTWT